MGTFQRFKHINNMSETKAKEQKVSKSIAQEASDDQAYQTDMHYARKEITIKRTYHCENCNVKFPVEDERFGLCRECNEDCGFCYECEKKDEKISKLESSNEEMLAELKELKPIIDEMLKLHWAFRTIDEMKFAKLSDRIGQTINKAEGN